MVNVVPPRRDVPGLLPVPLPVDLSRGRVDPVGDSGREGEHLRPVSDFGTDPFDEGVRICDVWRPGSVRDRIGDAVRPVVCGDQVFEI